MRILVCVKQVPSSESFVTVNDSTIRVRPAGPFPFRMNRFDEFAVEEAVRVKESHPDTVVDVISCGPQRAAGTIRRAMGMGADNGIHVMTGEEDYVPAAVTAARIAGAVEGGKYDLALAGVMSEDETNCQTGPMVAELLGMPCVTLAVKIELSEDLRAADVERELEGGMRESMRVELPAVITVQAGMNQPRYPSLSNVLKADSKKLEVIGAENFVGGRPWGGVRIAGADYPEKRRDSVFIGGSTEEKAERLLEILREKHFLPDRG